MKSYKFKVAGLTYHLDDLWSLEQPNDDYDMSKREIIEDGLEDEKIYKTFWMIGKTELIPDPDNEYDPNAIKVLMDGKLVGYVPKDETAEVKKLLDSGLIKHIASDVTGGNYKIVYSDYDLEKDKDVYEMEKDKDPYEAFITITRENTPEEEAAFREQQRLKEEAERIQKEKEAQEAAEYQRVMYEAQQIQKQKRKKKILMAVLIPVGILLLLIIGFVMSAVIAGIIAGIKG